MHNSYLFTGLLIFHLLLVRIINLVNHQDISCLMIISFILITCVLAEMVIFKEKVYGYGHG